MTVTDAFPSGLIKAAESKVKLANAFRVGVSPFSASGNY